MELVAYIGCPQACKKRSRSFGSADFERFAFGEDVFAHYTHSYTAKAGAWRTPVVD